MKPTAFSAPVVCTVAITSINGPTLNNVGANAIVCKNSDTSLQSQILLQEWYLIYCRQFASIAQLAISAVTLDNNPSLVRMGHTVYPVSIPSVRSVQPAMLAPLETLSLSRVQLVATLH